MTPVPSFSPLNTNYEQKYQDRPRSDVIGVLDFPFHDVLEIGCGSGATGSEVKRRYGSVYYCGVELDGEAAKIARKSLDFVATGNIEEMNPEDFGIQKHSFDVVICADVLEHLYDPWKVVTLLRDYLRPGGRVIASIPNVQNVRLIHNLLLGAWAYTEQGLLDATHIRFFTIREIGQLFVRNGYTIEQVLSSCDTEVPVGGTFPRDLDIGKAIIKQVTADDIQQLYTFQYLIRARLNPEQGGRA